MARKVMLSFVGTGNYVQCRYELKGEKPSKVVTYVQEALADYFFQDKGPDDLIILFFTKKSAEVHKAGIENSLQRYLPKIVDEVPESFSEEDNWEIFNLVFNELNVGDEVILDITHAFRSYATLASVLISYAKALKAIKVKGIYYGAFEKLGPARNVEIDYPNPEDRIAPLVDMSIYSTLQDWTYASATYVDTGNPTEIKKLTDEYLNARLQEKNDVDKISRKLEDLANNLEALELEIATVRGYDIEQGKSISRSIEILKDLENENDPIFVPIRELFNKISDNLKKVSNIASQKRWVSVVDWCIENNKIQQGITLLLEGVISEMCFLAGLSPDKLVDREIVGQSVNILNRKIPMNKWKSPAKDNIEQVESIQNNKKIIDLCGVYSKLNEIRNDINHAGYRPKYLAANLFKTSLKENFIIVRALLDV